MCQMQDFGHPAERTDDEFEPEEPTDSTGREGESDPSGSRRVKVTQLHKQMSQCLNSFQPIKRCCEVAADSSSIR